MSLSKMPMSSRGTRRGVFHFGGSWWSAAIVVIACATGGGDGGLPRVAVLGSVHLDGQPISKGSILFVPRKPTTGPKSGGPIIDGKYHIDEAEGPIVGNHHVEIVADVPLPAAPDDPVAFDAATGGKMPVNPVPPRYNVASELLVETKPDVDNHFDFLDLQSVAKQ